jgi:hypothetical protein
MIRNLVDAYVARHPVARRVPLGPRFPRRHPYAADGQLSVLRLLQGSTWAGSRAALVRDPGNQSPLVSMDAFAPAVAGQRWAASSLHNLSEQPPKPLDSGAWLCRIRDSRGADSDRYLHALPDVSRLLVGTPTAAEVDPSRRLAAYSCTTGRLEVLRPRRRSGAPRAQSRIAARGRPSATRSTTSSFPPAQRWPSLESAPRHPSRRIRFAT